MAPTATKTATTPRARTPRATKAAPKAAPPTPAAEVEAATEPKVGRYVVELEYERDTKRYAKFNVPASLEGTMAGSIYAPLGTDQVKIAIMGVDGDSSDEE